MSLYVPPVHLSVRGTGRHSEEPHVEYDVTILFSYDPWNPYSVQMAFGIQGHPIRTWEVARDNLVEALATRRQVGLGDFQAALIGPDALLLRLWDPTAGLFQVHVDIQVPASQVRNFLSRTLQAVPIGSEGERLNLDIQLAKLFA